MSKIYKVYVYNYIDGEHVNKVITSDLLEEYFEKGWEDSPAKWINFEKLGYNTDDALLVQGIGEQMAMQTESHNFYIDLENKTRFDMRRWAKDQFQLDLKLEKKSKMIAKLNKYLEEHNVLDDDSVLGEMDD